MDLKVEVTRRQNLKKMKKLLLVLFSMIPLRMACRPEGWWWEPEEEEEDKKKDQNKYFSPGESWGGWSPPEGDESWKEWIEAWGKYRTTDKPESDEWESQRGPGSGWPQHWKGYGLGIGGVPPPPWAYVPESYDKPQFCFHLPRFGHCSDNITRWGYNPSKSRCQTFFYSGCGGNENNFFNEASCKAACVDTAEADCVEDPDVNFEEMMSHDFNPLLKKPKKRF